MTKYIEAIEISESSNAGEMIRLEVTGTQAATVTKVQTLLDSNKEYKLRVHTCNHEEGISCTVEDIE